MKSDFQLFEKLSSSEKSELQRRSLSNGRSMESEALHITEAALPTPDQMGFSDALDAIQTSAQMGVGDILAAIGRFYQVEEQDIDFINSMRDRTPAEPMKFD